MGCRQETFELVKFQKYLGGTECHQCLSSGRWMGWGHCLKWGSESLAELVEVIWWCELTLQMLIFVRLSIAAKSVFYLEWASTVFMCDISFKRAWRCKSSFLRVFPAVTAPLEGKGGWSREILIQMAGGILWPRLEWCKRLHYQQELAALETSFLAYL